MKVGLEPLAGWQGLALVLYGDAPLLQRETVEALLAEARRTGGLALLTARAARSHRLRAHPARPQGPGAARGGGEGLHPGRSGS